MNELTMVLFLMTIGVYLASYYIKKVEVQWLGIFLSVSSIAVTLMDETLSMDETTVLIILPFFVMLLMGTQAFMNKG